MVIVNKQLHIKAYEQGRLTGSLGKLMGLVADAFQQQGYTITKDTGLIWQGEPPGIIDTLNPYNALNVYTNTSRDKVTTENNLFLGASGPLPGYFTLDRLGVWPWITPTYNNISTANYERNDYPHDLINSIKEQKQTLFYSNLINKGLDSPEPEGLPEDHVLMIVSQMDNDWQDGWAMFGKVINRLILGDCKYPVVVKFDPRLLLDKDGNVNKSKLNAHKPMMDSLEARGVKFYTGAESLHCILPKTRVVIVDEMSQFLEPLMYGVPVITHGAPPYHGVVKKIEHQHELIPAIQDVSWSNEDLMNAWLAYYITSYACHDLVSTTRRVKELLDVV
tara:strand:- start:104 stop:1105 length:1002 start_codon:yes stop_codon:yes gene_type:complete